MANGLQHCCNLNGSTFKIFIKQSEGKGCWKKSLLVLKKILRLFVITLPTDEKHYLVNRDNLTQPIQKPLPQKQEHFSEFFLAFLKSVLNFRSLPTIDDRHSGCFSGNTGSALYG